MIIESTSSIGDKNEKKITNLCVWIKKITRLLNRQLKLQKNALFVKRI